MVPPPELANPIVVIVNMNVIRSVGIRNIFAALKTHWRHRKNMNKSATTPVPMAPLYSGESSSADLRKVDIIEVFVLFYLFCSLFINVSLFDLLLDPTILVFLFAFKVFFNYFIRTLSGSYATARTELYFVAEVAQVVFLLTSIFWNLLTEVVFPSWYVYMTGACIFCCVYMFEQGRHYLAFVTTGILLALLPCPNNSWKYIYLANFCYLIFYLLEAHMKRWRADLYEEYLVLSVPLLKLPVSLGLPYFFFLCTYRLSNYMSQASPDPTPLSSSHQQREERQLDIERPPDNQPLPTQENEKEDIILDSKVEKKDKKVRERDKKVKKEKKEKKEKHSKLLEILHTPLFTAPIRETAPTTSSEKPPPALKISLAQFDE